MFDNLFRRKPKRSVKELYETFPRYPEFVVDITYDIFLFGAFVALTQFGTPQFDRIMQAFNSFMEETDTIVQEGQNNGNLKANAIRDYLLNSGFTNNDA